LSGKKGGGRRAVTAAGRRLARPAAGGVPAAAWPWPRIVRLAIMAAGFLISAYLTDLHYQHAVPACSAFVQIINCQNVLTSPYAVQLGVPVSAWGGLYFLLGAIPLLWPVPRPWPLVHALAGVAVVVALVYTELLVVGNICEWCTAVHVLVVANWLILMFARTEPT
jgi:uncharacterized membrane protein